MIKKVTDRIGLVSLIAVACIICCLMGFSSGKNPEEKPRRVTTLEGLRYELELAQVRLLPVTEESVSFDGGAYLFEPDPSDVGASLLLSLLSSEEIGALGYWPITLYEDPISREMVILDSKGAEAIRLPCPLDYDPNWVLDLFYPLTMGVIDEAFFEPAKVCLSMRLFRNIKVRSTVQVSSDTKTTNRVSTVAISTNPDLLVEDKKATATKEAIQSPVSQKQMLAIDPFMAPPPSAEGETQPLVAEMGLDSDSDGLTDLEEYSMRKAVAWGQNTYGQGTIPAVALNAVTIVAGYNHNLALRADGSVVAWGQNTYGQCTVPSSVSNVVSIAAGGYHSLALRSNATVIAWGYNINAQCSVPVSASNVVALTAGLYHSAALRSDGKVIAWGQNSYGQCTVPTGATNIVAIASGNYHNLALRGKGSVVAWGQNSNRQCAVPASATNVVAVAGGGYHSLALRSDGKVLAWGQNSYQQCTVPASVVSAIAIGAGQYFSYAILSDGRIIAWGQNTYAQCAGASTVAFALSVMGGANHGVAIWGPNPFNPDSDGDGMSDGWEVSQGLDLLSALDAGHDADGDGLRDAWELAYGFDPLTATPLDSDSDSDGDGLNTLAEAINNTNPTNSDTDGDGISDGLEVLYGLDPLNASDASLDSDSDGLSNLAEHLGDTNPLNPDTDGDTLPDGWEVLNGLNPLDVADAVLDSDSDDFSNRYEYHRNSSPTNTLSIPQPSIYVNGAATTSGNGTLQQPFKTLRSALQAATNYSIIQVAAGIYTGADNRNLSFLGKPLMMLSTNGATRCIIDCQKLGYGVAFENNEDAQSVLRGITIRNGCTEGGAIRCLSASPLIQACRFEANGAPDGMGGAIYNAFANPTLENCIIGRNSAAYGGGIYNDQASPLLRNCTFAGNVAALEGGALYNADTNSCPILINTLVWGNGSAPLAGAGKLLTQHSMIEGGMDYSQLAPGSDFGLSSADPQLTTEYRLKPTSPCIDAGMSPAPLRDIEGELRFDVIAVTNGEWIVDIGADEYVDADADGLVDTWERDIFNTLNRDGTGDWDKDGLSDREEYLNGCNPISVDTDGDGLPDQWEISQGLDPLDDGNAGEDSDGDGVCDREEYLAGTDPRDADTDKDGLSDFKELRSGVVRAWGTNNLSQCNLPANLTNATAIAAGMFNSFALREDGTFVGWSVNLPPTGVTNLLTFSTKGNHVLALCMDGSVLAWGNNTSGQCTVPASASNALIFAAGAYHSLALRSDGTVVAWGNNTYGQCTVPATATNVIAIAAGDYHSLALRMDGTVIAWGQNTYRQIYPLPSATNIIAIAAGSMHNLAIRADGSVIAWGADNRKTVNGYIVGTANPYGQCTVPATATNVCAIAVGANHSLAVRRDGKVIAWGLNAAGQCSGAMTISNAVAIAGGFAHSLALIRLNPLKSDTDGDSLPDAWEINHSFDPLNNLDASQDTDSDGLTNLSEFTYKTDPRNADTDSDGMADAWELVYWLNPLNPEDALLDLDGDGVSNKREYDAGSNPYAGYFMKENFATGIPSDWTQSAWPQVAMKWGSMKSWDNFITPIKPASISGQMLYVVRSKPGKVRITSPVVNLGRDMSNVILKFLCWRGPHAPGSIASLNIYTISRLQQPDGSISDQEKVLSKIDLKTGPTAWTSISLHLPDGCATRQLIFEYENSVDYSMNVPLALGICIGEISLVGDEGRVAYQPVAPIIETCANLPIASKEMPYSCQLAVRGGVPPFQWRYEWTLVNGTLPQGLTLDPIAGTIKGFPVEQGKSIFSIEVKNDEGMATTNQFELTVMESVKALSETFDKQWLPGWGAAGWGPLVDVKALNGGNTNAWGRGSATAYATLVTPMMDFGGTPEKAVLCFRYRNPLYTPLNYRDHLIVSYQEGSTTQIIASTFDTTLNPNPTWQLLPETDKWKEIVIYLPAQSTGGKILFQAYTRQIINNGTDCGVSIDDVKVFAAYADPLFLAWLAQHFPDGASSGFYDDPDHDGLNNLQEYDKNTDPHVCDTDDDGLTDGIEVARGTDPLNTDTDGDGLEDGDEVLIYGTDPLDSDTDNDGLCDRTEILLGSDPLNSDTDGDTLNDGWELSHGYSLLVIDDPSIDSDNDGLTDGQESLAETNPHKVDSDGDGVSDTIELLYGFNPNQYDEYVDTDKDGLPDKLEIAIGTDPKNWDTDGDRMSDGWEVYGGINPLSAIGAAGQQGDPDADGLCNFDEYINGTSPTKKDTDGDTVSDKDEVDQGSNPSDKSDLGQAPPASEIVEIPFTVGGDFASWEMKIVGQGPQDKRALLVASQKPGDAATKIHKLRKGNSYKITMQWRSSLTIDNVNWYCWEAIVGGLPQLATFNTYSSVRKPNIATTLFGQGFYVDNKEGLLTTHVDMCDGKGGNVAGGLSAMLYVLKIDMAMDGNRDGNIEFDKPEDRQAIFWVNNDHDVKQYNEDMWQEDDMETGTPNCDDDTIGVGISSFTTSTVLGTVYHTTDNNCLRDLEDFTRLHVRIGTLPAGMPTNDITCWMRFKNATEGSPKVKLFKALKSDQSYIETIDDAVKQAKEKTLTSVAINQTTDVKIDMQHIKLNTELSSFLLEGCSEGKGNLSIVMKNAGTEIAKTSVFINLHNITNFYDVYQASVNFNDGEWLPDSKYLPIHKVKSGYTPARDEVLLFVHGWNMAEWEKGCWTQTIFKRLWWQGYKGRVVSFEWPTLDGFGSLSDVITQLQHFDRSEYRAWLSANSLFTTLCILNENSSLRVMAHSMGNVVTGEALKKYTSTNKNKIHTYIACQAAISSQYYGDVSSAYPCRYKSFDPFFPNTPDILSHYDAGETYMPSYLRVNSGVGQWLNWYNDKDWALDNWERNNIYKPDGYGGCNFSYQGKISSYDKNVDKFLRDGIILNLENETERYMSFAFIIESRSCALGRVEQKWYENMDLEANMGYNERHYSHSRQFRSNVIDEKKYWETVFLKCNFRK